MRSIGLAPAMATGLGLALIIAVSASPAAARTKLRHAAAVKAPEHLSKEPFGDIPKGPLQIFVSIDQQKLHLYSDGVHVADTSVATGVPSLPTPLGAFSVIQKQIFHRSNLYSNAPMPFMQRITWSGVALHEGENIGHRASHGCIRMPREFAERLYRLTRLGARVIVANPELKPVEIADPHLFVHKDKPVEQVAAAPAPSGELKSAPAATETVKTAVLNAVSADTVMAVKPAELGLRIGDAPVAADAPKFAVVTTTDPVVSDAPKPAESGAPEPVAAPPQSAAVAPSDAGAVDAAKPAPVKASDPPAGDPIAGDGPKPVVAATSETVAADPPQPVAAAPSDPPAAKAEPATPVAPAAPAAAGIAAPDGAASPLPAAKPAELAKAVPAKKTPISIFISRKTKKLYVRQDFAPLFDADISIEHPDQPIGTHVFTAMDYLDDHASFRWTVVTFPGEPPRAKRSADNEQKSDRHGRARRRDDDNEKPAADLPAPQTPQQALARIAIPQDTIDAVSQLMVPGSSLIISDQGLGDETGEGTDFVVVLR